MIPDNYIEAISNSPSAVQEPGFGLVQGDDTPDSRWESLVNMRLKQDGMYRFWKLRGGSSTKKTLSNEIVTLHSFEARVSGALKKYIVAHISDGSIQLWDVEADTVTEIMSGFSTSVQVQIEVNSHFIYVFDYNYGEAKYYDLATGTLSDWLSYNYNYITGHSFPENTQTWEENSDSAFNFKVDQKVIFFPRLLTEFPDIISSLPSPYTYTANDGGDEVYRYIYNGGKYYTDDSGKDYLSDQIIIIKENENLTMTLNGSGDDPELRSLRAPIVNDKVSYEPWIGTITSIDENSAVIKNDSNTLFSNFFEKIVFNQNSVGVLDSGGYIFPFNTYLWEYVQNIEPYRKEEDGEIIINENYKDPFIHRGYVIIDLLNDGSITVSGKPYLLSITLPMLHSDEDIRVIKLNVESASSNNIAKRYLCSTRWLPDKEMVFNPSSSEFSNSAFFINKEVDKSATTIEDLTPDTKLVRPITELISLSAGITNLFGPGQVTQNSIARFTGSLMLGGYRINRPAPLPYTDASLATNHNIFLGITETTQLDDDVLLSFMFEYSDGKKSEVVDTDEYLQEGTVGASTKSIGSITITGVSGGTGTLSFNFKDVLEITYEVGASDTKEDVANALNTYLNTNSADYESEVNTDGSDPILEITSKRAGLDFNGIIEVVDNDATVSYTKVDLTGGEYGIENSANQVQIHSLNSLVSKVYILGRVEGGEGDTYHVLKEVSINDPEAHGLPIDLPNTTEGLTSPLASEFTVPSGSEIMESIYLSDYINIGAPFQVFPISGQKPNNDQSKITRVIPIDFDVDKTVMRYRVLVFTTSNIQMGYIVNNTGVFDADFEIIEHGLVASGIEGITNIKNNTFFTTKKGLFVWSGGSAKIILDRRRYDIINTQELRDVVYNPNHNEFWFIFNGLYVIVFHADSGVFNLVKYNDENSVRAGTELDDMIYVGRGAILSTTDDETVYTDNSEAYTGEIYTKHIGNRQVQRNLLDVAVYGQGYTCKVELDEQTSRYIGSSGEWSKSFTADTDLGTKELSMEGEIFPIHTRVKLARLKFTVTPSEESPEDGFIDSVELRTIPTPDEGMAQTN